MTEKPITATDVLRETVRARNRSPHAFALVARELDGVSTGLLEDFAAGKADPNVEVLKGLTKLFYPTAEFDEATNLLRSTAPEPKPLGIRPAPYDIEKHPAHAPPPIGPWTKASGITGLPPSPHAGPPTRPGWAR